VRDWVALYPSILDSGKWADLPDDTARLGWIVSILLAARQPHEGRFDSTGKLVRLLAKEGIEQPDLVVASLVEAGCLDIEDEEVSVRGWAKWQRRWRGPSDDPALKAAAERERYWREKAQSLNLGASGESLGGSGIEERRVEEIRGEESVRADARKSSMTPSADDPPDSQDRYYELTTLRPWGRSAGRWLLEMDAGFGVEPVRAALDAEWAKSQDRATFLSRVEARLAKAADRVRQSKVEEVKRKPKTNGVSPEVAARQRAALGEMIGGPKGRAKSGEIPEERQAQG
jgi:hypothetical protein